MDYAPEMELMARKQLATNSPINQCQTNVSGPLEPSNLNPVSVQSKVPNSYNRRCRDTQPTFEHALSTRAVNQLNPFQRHSIFRSGGASCGTTATKLRPLRGVQFVLSLLDSGLRRPLDFACRMAPNGPTEVYGRIYPVLRIRTPFLIRSPCEFEL